MDRVELIRRSVRCFTFGLLGLIPVLGLPVAGLALSEFVRATRRAAVEWNPGSAYLHSGLVLACVAMTLTAALLQLLLLVPLTEILMASLWT